MSRVVSVRLRRKCRVYDFDAGDLELSLNDWVIVDTARGHDAGQVVVAPREVPEEEVRGDLKAVLRLADASDFGQLERSARREEEALQRAQTMVDDMGLPMQLVAADYTYNGRSLTIYFTADKRVDFRELVKKLARSLRTRIELRQVGARDEARLIGGIGPCGRMLCCETFLCDFQRISVRMAKEQNLPLNPMKISGVCGRLLCCLRYEYEQYREVKKILPTVGEEVVTLRGRGQVVSVSVPREAVTVEVRPGLTVEVAAEELAQAAQLEAAGQLAPVQPSYVSLPQKAVPVPAEQELASPGEQKRRRRRRRRKKKTAEEAPATAATSTQQQRSQQPAPSKKRKQTPAKGGRGPQKEKQVPAKGRRGPQKEKQTTTKAEPARPQRKAASSPQTTTRKRRRRRRKSPPDGNQ